MNKSKKFFITILIIFLLITSIYFFYKKYTIEGNGAQNSLNNTIVEINKKNKKEYKYIVLKKPSKKMDLSKKLNTLYENLSNFLKNNNNNKDIPVITLRSNKSLIEDFEKTKNTKYFKTVTVEMLLKYLNYNRADLGITYKPPLPPPPKR